MAYLVRRLLENTANDSFLRQTFVEGDGGRRSRAARLSRRRTSAREPAGCPSWSHRPAARPGRSVNEPHADFSRRENREAYDAALAAVRRRLGAHYPLRIGGRDIETARTLDSVNPAAPDEVVGTVAYGGRAEAEAAVAAARAAVPGVAGRHAGGARRRALPRRRPDARRDRASSSALMTLEAGKTWREADADVDEAIDFLRVLRARDAAPRARPGAWATCPASTTSTSTSLAASPS